MIPCPAHRHFLLRPVRWVLAAALGLAAASCGPKPSSSPGAAPPAFSAKGADGTRAERIAEVTALLSRRAALPGSLLDAHFLEEQQGDGVLGPSDFAAFYALSVAPADLPAWQAALAPLESHHTPAAYAVPRQAAPWWVTAGDFTGLKFYSPKSLTGRSNGWVGLAADGRVFIYAFTL